MKYSAALPACLLVLAAFTTQAESTPTPGHATVQSPRLTELTRSLAAGQSGALAAFWRDLERTHTPLMEPAPGTQGEMIVTFLWRSAEPVNAGVYAPFVDLDEAVPGRLSRLGQSDVWYRSYQLSDQARFRYYLAWPQGRSADARATWRELHREVTYELFPDPANPKWLPIPDGDEIDRVSYAEGPNAPSEPFVAERPNVVRGKVMTVELASAILGNRRKISVYTPPGYQRGRVYDFLLLFDREQYLTSVPTPTILDNMIADGAIAPVIAVLVGNIDDATRSAELPPNPKFQAFLREELMTWVRERYSITSDPQRATVAGSSYGGLCAAYTAFTHPDIFGKVLSQSGAFAWWPGYSDHEDPARELTRDSGWLQRQFATTSKLPLRFYLDAGSWETTGTLLTNRQFRDLLGAMAYPVTYREFIGGHEHLLWRSTLSDGLKALSGDNAARATEPEKPAD